MAFFACFSLKIDDLWHTFLYSFFDMHWHYGPHVDVHIRSLESYTSIALMIPLYKLLFSASWWFRDQAQGFACCYWALHLVKALM
jgi:hypothetical protein